MPKVPKNKKEVSYSLPIELIRHLNKTAKEKGLNRSQFLTEILFTIFKNERSYIEYELLRSGQEFNAWKHRAENHNLEKE